jgi:SPP1 gp7 family putative phage head morphogenesis protein
VLLSYRLALVRIVGGYAEIVRRILLPVLDRFAALEGEPGSRVRTDARKDDEVFRALRSAVAGLGDASRLHRAVGEAARKTERHSRAELKRLGIRLREVRPELAPVLDRWRDRNISLVRSLFDREILKLERILEHGETRRVEVLRDEIEERLGVTRSKADLLARDQVLKLNGELTHELHVSAGIDEYIWTTGGDERVRESHAVLDGTRQRWDTPPVVSEDGRTGHPGDDYQCRCTAFPVLPELEEK